MAPLSPSVGNETALDQPLTHEIVCSFDAELAAPMSAKDAEASHRCEHVAGCPRFEGFTVPFDHQSPELKRLRQVL
jgi:hypothetical protein